MTLNSTSKTATREILWPIVRPHMPLRTIATILNALHGFAITFQVFTVGWLIDWVLGKGAVPQDHFIFRTTIRRNIQVAKPDATDAEIESACSRANAWEFIPKLAEGLDTRVGEGGSNLNGGPRLATDRNCQRILFLRNGQIQQDGSYDSLVTIPGLFRELVEGKQLSIS